MGHLLQVEEYALSRGYPESTTFSAVLQQFAIESQQEQLYFMCSHSGMLAIARATDDILNLSLKDRAAMCTAPVDEKNKPVFNAFLNFIDRSALSKLTIVCHLCTCFSILPDRVANCFACQSGKACSKHHVMEL